jgi:hypothetical protein
VTLVQGPNQDEEVVGYLTNTNLSEESGITLSTNWSLDPKPEPVDFYKLRNNTDPNWELTTLPFSEFRKATKNVDFFLPRVKRPEVPRLDEWVRLRNGENFTLQSLGFCSDIFPQLVEFFEPGHGKVAVGKNWYPTLVLNLDIKKTLPAEGVEFLLVSVKTLKIENGRFDLQIHILDQNEDLIAISHHVSLVLSASRNIAERKPRKKLGDVKL